MAGLLFVKNTMNTENTGMNAAAYGVERWQFGLLDKFVADVQSDAQIALLPSFSRLREMLRRERFPMERCSQLILIWYRSLISGTGDSGKTAISFREKNKVMLSNFIVSFWE